MDSDCHSDGSHPVPSATSAFCGGHEIPVDTYGSVSWIRYSRFTS